MTSKTTADWKNRPEDILILLEGINDGIGNVASFKKWLAKSGRSLSREYDDVQIGNKITEIKKWNPERRKQEEAKRVVAQGKSAREAKKAVEDAVKMDKADAELDGKFQDSHLKWGNGEFDDDDEEYVPPPPPSSSSTSSSPPPQVRSIMSPPAPKKRSPIRPLALDMLDDESPARLTREHSFEVAPPIFNPY